MNLLPATRLPSETPAPAGRNRTPTCPATTMTQPPAQPEAASAHPSRRWRANGQPAGLPLISGRSSNLLCRFRHPIRPSLEQVLLPPHRGESSRRIANPPPAGTGSERKRQPVRRPIPTRPMRHQAGGARGVLSPRIHRRHREIQRPESRRRKDVFRVLAKMIRADAQADRKSRRASRNSFQPVAQFTGSEQQVSGSSLAILAIASH